MKDNEVEMRCSMSNTKYGECDVNEMTMICKMNQMEMNELYYGT